MCRQLSFGLRNGDQEGAERAGKNCRTLSTVCPAAL
jgi:hypothetical protein